MGLGLWARVHITFPNVYRNPCAFSNFLNLFVGWCIESCS